MVYFWNIIRIKYYKYFHLKAIYNKAYISLKSNDNF